MQLQAERMEVKYLKIYLETIEGEPEKVRAEAESQLNEAFAEVTRDLHKKEQEVRLLFQKLR